LQLTEIVISKY